MTKRSSKRRVTRPTGRLTTQQIGWASGLLAIGVAALTLVGLVTPDGGTVTHWWLGALRSLMGWGVWLTPLALGLLGAWGISLGLQRPLAVRWPRLLGLAALWLSALGLSHLFSSEPSRAISTGLGSGYLGYWASRGLTVALGWLGSAVVLVMLIGLSLVLVLQVSLDELVRELLSVCYRILDWWRDRWAYWATRRAEIRANRPRPSASQQPLPLPQQQPAAHKAPQRPTNFARQQSAANEPPPLEAIPAGAGQGTFRRWQLPAIEDLLAESVETPTSLSDIRERTHIIEETLRSLGVPVTVVEVNPGPVVTQYGLEPGFVERRDRNGKVKKVKVKVSRISALANDLALALAASPIRIEAPVPGKGIVGLEVPNSQPDVVGLRGVMESDEFAALRAPLAVALGRDVSGAAVVDDLVKLPHLLIAGATGSGKSVCINALIACLLSRNAPDDLKLLMIDPKRVELSLYNGIPHLLAPVVVEVARVVGVLNWLTHEMERRYKELARLGVRHIQGYNDKALASGETKLPYIVVFIDELADLMMVAPEEVERSVCRLAQMARATGIHLVIATQRPSVDVVTGLIKANFSARIAFAVTSQIDSRVILDLPGAEKLLGRGDALYMAPDSPKLARIQGCWVADQELQRLVGFWKGQLAAHPEAAPALPELPATIGQPMVQQAIWPDLQSPPTSPLNERNQPPDERDPLLNEAVRVVVQEQKASVSLLQRHLRIGYSRASRLIDLLEEDGVIGPATGTSKPREVLHKAEEAKKA
jgi:S-DNA-T family DNA segregation ATPase FtsK/SpoIIIE